MRMITIRAEVGVVEEMDAWAERLKTDRSRIANECFKFLGEVVKKLARERIAEAAELAAMPELSGQAKALPTTPVAIPQAKGVAKLNKAERG